MEQKKRLFKKGISFVVQRVLLGVFMITGLFVGSCRPSENILYEEFKNIDASGWNWDAGSSFTFEIESEEHYYNILNGLRITSNYAYSNIWMIYILKGPDGFYQKDQFQLELSDQIGRWKGKKVSNMISYQEPFLLQLPLKKGTYTLTLFQNMRDENLKEVSNVGIQVVKGQLKL
jgi:gliding motility-associated lipoprotein GldH